VAAYRRLYPGDSLRDILAMPWTLFQTMLHAQDPEVPADAAAAPPPPATEGDAALSAIERMRRRRERLQRDALPRVNATLPDEAEEEPPGLTVTFIDAI
jgi:hypothetical protein